LVQGNVYNALQYNDDPRSLIENAIGSFGNDQITGNAAYNELQGDAGNDTLIGGEGNDTMRGGANDDLIDGGAGEDLLSGGSGNDTLSYSTAQRGVTVKLHANSVSGDIAQGDTIFGFENVSGGAGSDLIEGDSSNNILDGREGDDWFDGRDGADTIYGWIGNDAVHGGDGNDSIYGGDSNDWLEGGEGADLLDGGAGWDVNSHLSATSGVIINLATNQNGGAAAGDVISNIEVLQGSNFADTLTSVDRGGGHGAQLYGEGGHDTLLGQGGGDYLFGGSGNDTLDSGFGGDVLDGGAGADTFRFSSGLGAGNVDTIQDFSGAEGDRIVLGSTVFMDVGTGPLSSAYFSLGAATSFDHHILYHQGTGELFYDVDGSGGVAAIKFAALTAGTALSAANFLVI
jgi:Ca2+-binding RTX toxin-like protein